MERKPVMLSPEDQQKAACNGKSDLSFFPLSNYGKLTLQEIQRAKDTCARCPVRVQCLKIAVENGYFGIWGGTTEDERKTIRENERKRRK